MIAGLEDAGVIPDPFAMPEFIDRIAELRTRPIRVVAMPLVAGGPYGMVISAATTDYLCLPDGSSPFHRVFIAAHEIGHLLFGHYDGGFGGAATAAAHQDVFKPDDEDIVELFAELLLVPRLTSAAAVADADLPAHRRAEATAVTAAIEQMWGR